MRCKYTLRTPTRVHKRTPHGLDLERLTSSPLQYNELLRPAIATFTQLEDAPAMSNTPEYGKQQ